MASKIGTHVIIGPRNGFGPFLETTKDKLAIVKCVDDFGAATEAKALDPNVLTVGRVNEARHYQTGQMVDMTAWEPRGAYKERTGAVLAAYDYYQTVKPYWEKNPQIDVWETFNEFSFHWEWQGWFYIAMMDLAELDDYTLAIYACSSGNPPDLFVQNEMIESLREAKKRVHYLSMHEYGGIGTDILTLKGTEPFHALRYRQMYKDVWSKASADPPLILSEIGQAGGFDYLGWDILGPDLEWYDNELAKDEYVVGATLFTLGKWYQSNYQDALPELADHIVTFQPDFSPPDPPKPPEIDDCKPRLRYKQVYHYLEHTQARPAPYIDRLAVFNESDKTAGTYGNSFDHALYGPGVDVFCIAYGIERARQMEFTAFRNQYYPDARLEFKPIPNVEPAPDPDTIEFIYPVRGVRVVTSPYGQRDPGPFHFGVDLRAPMGERVYAAADGVVEFVGYDTAISGGYGYYIRLRHPQWGNVKTYYAHLLDDEDGFGFPPPLGEKIEVGLHMAYSNNTGNSFGSHLHWGLKKNNLYVDPMPYLRADQQPDTPPSPPVVGNAWVGLHLQHHINEETVQDEMATITTGRIEAVKFNTNANIESGLNPLLASDVVDPSKMVMRLYMAGNSPTLKVPADFVDVMAIHLDWLKNATKDTGGGYVEIHNEPNLLDEGFGFAWNSPQEFHGWLLRVVTELRARWPALKFGYPGLSPNPNVNAFLDDLLSNGNLLNKLDWIGIHAYWVDSLQMFFSEHGGYYRRYVPRFPNHDLLITEFAHKATIKPGEPSKGEQYVKYYAGLPPTIKAAYSYITVDANYPLEQWTGTDIARVVGDR